MFPNKTVRRSYPRGPFADCPKLFWCGGSIVTLAVAMGFAPAEPPSGEAARLVTQLSGDSFRDREAAAKALLALGEDALPALGKAEAGSPDAEVRRAAKR